MELALNRYRANSLTRVAMRSLTPRHAPVAVYLTLISLLFLLTFSAAVSARKIAIQGGNAATTGHYSTIGTDTLRKDSRAAGSLTGLNGLTLGYDPWGNLSSASGAFGTASYTTDSRGNRVSKTVNGTTTYYLYDGDLLIAEVNSAGQVQTAYTWGPLGVISDRINLQGTPQSRFYEFDATGSTRALLDQNGVGLSRGTYSAWGSSTGYTPGTPLAWQGETGCYTDAETGLVQMGARCYSPSLGRFTRRDPAGLVNGPNVYAYCGDDPVNLADPTGTDFDGIKHWVMGNVPGLNFVEHLSDFNDAATKFGNAYSQELYGKGSPDAVVAAIDGMKAPLGALAGDTLNTGMVPGAALEEGAASAAAEGTEGAVGEGEEEAPCLLQRYLGESGGRWGGTATRRLNDSLVSDLEGQGYNIAGGAGRAPEEWFAGPGGGIRGGTFVDITAVKEGQTVRIQTVSTRADGMTPTPGELAAAARIRARFPNDVLKLVPKR